MENQPNQFEILKNKHQYLKIRVSTGTRIMDDEAIKDMQVDYINQGLNIREWIFEAHKCKDVHGREDIIVLTADKNIDPKELSNQIIVVTNGKENKIDVPDFCEVNIIFHKGKATFVETTTKTKLE